MRTKHVLRALLPTVAYVIVAAVAVAEPEAFDIAKPQSPPKPAPDWVKIVDQGDLNSRLKGFKLPEGVRVEIIAEEPVTINPVGMAFAPDGTPYVLEWTAK